MVAVIIIVVVVVLLALLLVGSYNGIVRMRNQVDNGWSQIDVQIKRRADLIPNLVETVKGYAAHESGTFEAVVAARGARSAGARRGLKADANFRQLQSEITATEDRIAYARQFYNDSVTRYHNKIDTFPGVAVSKIGSFPHRELFEADEADRAVPKVEF